MALDFQQVRHQIQGLVDKAPQREQDLRNLRDQAETILSKYAVDLDFLRDKVARAVALNPGLRCAVPTTEALTDTFPLPDLPTNATIIAADGSQINPNRHWAIEYCLVNVGAIEMQLGSGNAPLPTVKTELFYDQILYTFTEGMVALIRDQREREILADLAEQADQPVITFADGPIELWGREQGLETTQPFEKYLMALSRLHKINAATAGYVDKPRSDLVVRLLELAVLDEGKLSEAGKNRWMLGIFDTELYEKKLDPGERSPIFALQSLSTKRYQEHLAIHFFYLNVSLQEDDPWLVRVEVPAWVAEMPELVNSLHAVLVDQCQVIHNAQYPYLLHRAHETAVVSRDEKDQVDMMISLELRRRGVEIGRMSAKETAKENARKRG